MNTLRKQPIPLPQLPPQGLVRGRVCATAGAAVEVEIGRQRLAAKTACSCLIVPQAGDLVLCDCTEPGSCYILGVLERFSQDRAVLNLPDEVVLRSKSTTLLCEGDLNLFSGREIHKSGQAVFDVEEVTATGHRLQASYQAVHLISRMISTMARHVVERMKTYLRHTEDLDQLKAGQMTRQVEGLYNLQSRHTVMVSEKDTKIDGQRIHMG